MLFTYPAQAVNDNWIHDCIEAAFDTICNLLNSQQNIPAWPAIIPQAKRNQLLKKRTLPKLLKEFEEEASKLTNRERDLFLVGFRQQNQIARLLDGSVVIPNFEPRLLPLVAAAKAVCDEGFALLDRVGTRKVHYQIIYDHLVSKTCPFCGMEPFDAPTQASEDDDHYLARTIYPLAAANFRNLAPMGGKCNQRYKRKKDMLLFNGVRRKALDPYGNICIDISLINSDPLGGAAGRPAWQIDIVPDIEEAVTWENVFSIRSRLTDSVLTPYFDAWISELPDWFNIAKIDQNSGNAELIKELAAFTAYKTKHREQGAGYFKSKVLELLLHHCNQGNPHVLAMIRSCLPRPKAA